MSLKKDIISFNFYPFYGNLHLYFLFITLMGTSNLIQSKNKIIIDQITYNDIYVGTDKELMITDLNLYLKLNDKVIFSENVNVNDLSFSNV